MPFTFDQYHDFTAEYTLPEDSTSISLTSSFTYTGGPISIPLTIFKNGAPIYFATMTSGSSTVPFVYDFAAGDTVKFDYNAGAHPTTSTFIWRTLNLVLDGHYDTRFRQAWVAILINDVVKTFNYYTNTGGVDTYTIPVNQPIANGDRVVVSFGLSDAFRIDFFFPSASYEIHGNGVTNAFINPAFAGSFVSFQNAAPGFQQTVSVPASGSGTVYEANGFGGGSSSRISVGTMTITTTDPTWTVSNVQEIITFRGGLDDATTPWT